MATREGSTPHLERMISVPMQPGFPRLAETNRSSNCRPAAGQDLQYARVVGRAASEDDAVRGDQQGEPGQAEDPGEDDVGEPVVAEEDPAEPHGRRPGDGEDDAQGDAEAVVEPTATR